MKKIRQIYNINALVRDVWQALVDPKIIERWGGGPAKMDDKIGTKFTLWGGDIYGKNIKVVKNKELVQEWFGGEWEKPSIVKFTLKEKDGKTELGLSQEDVPDEEENDIAKGWKQYYLGSLKELLEK